MSNADRDADRLDLMIEPIDKIRARTSGLSEAAFIEDDDQVDLTAYRLSTIGEQSRKLSPELKSRHPTIDWRAIYAMRNIIAHEYRLINARIVWQTIVRDLEALKTMCTAELARIDGRE
jgi:uncharacterized protein with HEPN domain